MGFHVKLTTKSLKIEKCLGVKEVFFTPLMLAKDQIYVWMYSDRQANKPICDTCLSKHNTELKKKTVSSNPVAPSVYFLLKTLKHFYCKFWRPHRCVADFSSYIWLRPCTMSVTNAKNKQSDSPCELDISACSQTRHQEY